MHVDERADRLTCPAFLRAVRFSPLIVLKNV
jgi:hypothetical protein